jgi:uncharacterized surface protein with fasciclin (FAS1) repeats
MTTSRHRKLAALVLPLALFVAACGSDGSDGKAASSDTPTTQATASDNMTSSDAATTDDMTSSDTTDMAAPEGPACSAVPTSGAGSFEGMAQDPVATAASNNPALSTLVTAVGKADLVDTLNTGGPFTVFAPINDAFAKIPEADLNAILADKDKLTSILTYHVVPEKIDPADLGGTYKTVNGAELTVSGDGPEFTVGSDGAKVVCSGIQTANATVYLIDSVLLPPAS